jgi:hypothetical protein
MSKPINRGSLIGLKSNLPPMPKVAPVALTAEMEEKILGPDSLTSLRKDTHKDDEGHRSTASPSPAPFQSALPASRKKEPTVLMNAKLPVRLHSRLKRTAQFNDISMTDILIRAIEAELATGAYVAPPEAWGSEGG